MVFDLIGRPRQRRRAAGCPGPSSDSRVIRPRTRRDWRLRAHHCGMVALAPLRRGLAWLTNLVRAPGGRRRYGEERETSMTFLSVASRTLSKKSIPGL